MQSLLKRIASALIVGSMILINSLSVSAYEHTTSTSLNNESAQKVMTAGIDDLDVQLNDLYKEVGNSLNIDYLYVKILHLMAGGKAVYADKRPNIYTDTTVDTMNGAFEIKGAKQSINKQAPWAYCPDPNINRPNKYYLPDAAYNCTADIVRIMNDRANTDRKKMQPYFDALKNEVKTNILFIEASMVYTGVDAEIVNNFYSIYEKILYDKDTYENVLQYNDSKEFVFKEKYKQILIDNGIEDDELLKMLSIILSFDKNLASADNPNQITDTFVVPYKVGYTSRENMMLASMSVIGKVRYVWGGGHLGTGNIAGINPMWEEFNNTYSRQVDGEGYQECIKPNISWCPVHSRTENANGCLMESSAVYSAEEYLDVNKEIKDNSSEIDKYTSLMGDVTYFEHGVTSHRFDGLDCSGYTSWVYNQIDRSHMYDGGASGFAALNKLEIVENMQNLLPGDIFSWPAHIVMVVGKVSDNSTAYVITEASPNTVKFGVIYNNLTPRSEVDLGLSIAKEANELIGKLDISERTNAYNVDSVSYAIDYIVTDEEGNEVLMSGTGDKNFGTFARLQKPFIDESTNIPDMDKSMIEMNATEIIQHTIKKLPNSYISGMESYTGKIFNTFDLKDTLEAPILAVEVNESTEIEQLEIQNK